MKNRLMRLMTVEEMQIYLREKDTIILPYALCEQHGYHLPLDTDIRNAEFAAKVLAEKLDCIIAPTLNYSFSGGMLPGTINVSPNTFSTLVGEIVESLALQGFKNIIILPGHDGSESLLHLKESLRALKWLKPALRDVMILLVPMFDFSPALKELFENNDYHAAWAETSSILYWSPEVVREKIVLDEEKVAARLREDPDSYQLRETLSTLPQEIPATSQRSDVKVGVMGYPEKATMELGKKIEQEFAENASKAIGEAITQAEENRKTGKRFRQDNGGKLKIFTI